MHPDHRQAPHIHREARLNNPRQWGHHRGEFCAVRGGGGRFIGQDNPEVTPGECQLVLQEVGSSHDIGVPDHIQQEQGEHADTQDTLQEAAVKQLRLRRDPQPEHGPGKHKGSRHGHRGQLEVQQEAQRGQRQSRTRLDNNPQRHYLELAE